MPVTAVRVEQPPSDSSTPTPLRRGTNRDRTQLLKMQQTLFELTQDAKVMPHIRAACARAWSDLQERKRVLDGKPLPGQLRPDLQQVKQHKRKGPSLLPLPEVPAPIVENVVKESP